jgi:hypothetical protein
MLWRKRRQVNEGRGVGSISRGLLAKNRLSNNVGVVNEYWRTLQHALDEERHFALAEEVAIQPRLARNQYSGLELSPTHASLRSTPRS